MMRPNLRALVTLDSLAICNYITLHCGTDVAVRVNPTHG